MSKPPPASQPDSMHADRTRTLGADRARPDGAFVLWWLHHAMRAEENPALDVAIDLANALRLPLLAYAAPIGGHPYDNDRHATFALQGLRDVQRDLAARGVRLLVRVPGASSPGGRADARSDSRPLDELVARAAIVVTEEMPAAPFPAWCDRLVARTGTRLVLVDAALVLPLGSSRSATDRAFVFRDRHATERDERVEALRGRPWPSPTLERAIERDPADLPFHPLELATTDDDEIASIVGRAPIDHGVAPVPDTRGGTDAGLARWRAFRAGGLARYAGARNDATRPGTSRLSAYLHWGMVSPFTIVREAAERGAEKFLDELLVWRELAWHWCHHVPDHDRYEALPVWARETLEAHADDPRPQVLSWERLARGRTGDRLWDLAQRSLLEQGELHNNVRMTWGKAILPWCASPRAAHAMLLDLNHRYALDGSDPSSFGGLLWCLGLFDRPFEPERAITGRLRPRSTRDHAKRLDLDRFEAIVARRQRPIRVAIVGAGCAGAMAARVLGDAGVACTVFEKSRGPGGRSATRRADDARFDHGALCARLADPAVAPFVPSWLHDGVIARWDAPWIRIADGERRALTVGPRFVGVPGMNAIASHLLGRDDDRGSGVRVELRTQVAIGSIERAEGDGSDDDQRGQWRLRDDAGDAIGVFDAVVCTAPPVQAARILRAGGARAPAALLDRLDAIVADEPMRALWTLMIELDRDPGFDAGFIEIVEGDVRWIVVERTKPGRDAAPGHRIVVHASESFVEANLEAERDAVVAALQPTVEALLEQFGDAGARIESARAHRWRFGLAARERARRADGDSSSLADDTGTLILAGDWTRGTAIDDALASGRDAAGVILRGSGRAVSWDEARPEASAPLFDA